MSPRGKHNNHPKADQQHRWSTKKIVNKDGYVKIRVGKEHPLADPNGYAYEHLVVWVSAGKPRPPKGFLLHHKNEVRSDNRIGNLELKKRGVHNALHNAQRGRNALGQFLPRIPAAIPTGFPTMEVRA